MRIFEFGEKYYFEDIGLRNCICGFDRRNDVGKIMENLVYLHLLQSGYKVFVGKLENEEIDFIAEKDGQRVYVQVAYLLADNKTSEREFGNLLKINDNYRKYVVTMDDYNANSNYNGIEHLHLRNFLTLSV
jgi:predicted AAA+ superfamily ATPase